MAPVAHAHRRGSAIHWLLASVLLAVPCVSANPPQTTSSKPQTGDPHQASTTEQTPPLRVTTHMVQVSVIVHDAKGEPITGLTKDDFELFDQGKKQIVASFSVAADAGRAPAAAISSQSEFSNRVEHRPGGSASVTVILLDETNTDQAIMRWARQRVSDFLEHMQPEDHVALYSLADGLMTVVHDFTSDGGSLLAALDKFQGTQTRQMEALRGPLTPAERAYFATTRGLDTPQALAKVGKHLSAISGRKNLIWLSGSFPIAAGFLDRRGLRGDVARRSFEEDIGQAAHVLTDANVAVYPVDARGLMPFADPQGFATMDFFAELTGGKAFYNTNDIGGAIRRAIGDSRVTYLLAYYPDHGQWNGEFREIKVKVDRPGAQVRARKGYFALGEETQLDQKRRAQLLADAANSPLDSSSLGLTVKTVPIDVPGARNLKSTLTIDAQDLRLNPNGSRLVGGVDLYCIERAKDDKVVSSQERSMHLNLTQKEYARLLREGLQVEITILIKPGASTVRVLATDADSGATGSVTIPLAPLFPSSTK